MTNSEVPTELIRPPLISEDIGLPSLETLVLNLDSDVPDATGVLGMGSRLACLDISKVQFPLFNNDTDCHCGVLVDCAQQCLRANVDYPELGPNCFICNRTPSC